MARKILASLIVLQIGIVIETRAVSVVTELPIPTAASRPLNIGQGGYDLWISEYDANKLARIVCTGFNTCSGSVIEINLPTPDSGPAGITASSDGLGRIGFTEFKAGKIGRVDPAGTVTEFSVPTPNAGPRGITFGDDLFLWFTEFTANKIGALSFDGAFTEYELGTPPSGPLAITNGPSGGCCNTDIWFTEFNGNKIGRISPPGAAGRGLPIEYSLPTPNAGPYGITSGQLGPSGPNAVWFTEVNANKIGRITPDGVIQEFSIPTPDSGPLSISFGDGGLWFTESRANKIARLNPDGSVDEFSILTPNSNPAGILGTWFVETNGNRVGRVDSDWLVAVGSGHAGVWDTEFDLANALGRSVNARIGERGPQICGICFDPTVVKNVPSLGVRHVLATEIPFVGEGFDTFLVQTALTPDDDLPTTRARIVNRARPSQSAEIPVTRYSTIHKLNPSVLTFPTATRDAGVHSNLVIAEVGADRFELVVLVEAYTADGELAGRSRPINLAGAQTIELVDVLQILDVPNLEDGQIRVTKVSGDGLLWGVLATAFDDGRLVISPGLNP